MKDMVDTVLDVSRMESGRMPIEAHGGEVGVTSRVGEGITFWFRLPSMAQREVSQGVAS